MSETSNPYAMEAFRASVADEIDAVDLPVTGALPPELTGRYLRNGPNPLPGDPPAHWFAGHGMLHGVRLRDGRAEWYRNRWVRTGQFAGRSRTRPDGSLDRTVVTANTHVIQHGGRIYALHEAGFPYEVTPELATLGPCDFDGRLTTAMTAHPKEDPETGDLHLYGYSARPPHLTYHRLSADGKLVHSREVAVPAGTVMHDMAITGRHVIWLDLPVLLRPEAARAGKSPFQWDDAYGARLGVMRHDVSDEPVRWFDIDPCYVFHVGNAYETRDGRIVLDAVRYSAAEFAALWEVLGGQPAHPAGHAAAAAATGVAHLHRWTLDPATGKATEEPLDDRAVEFPTVNDGLVGRPGRYLYAVAEPGGGHLGGIVKYDTERGTRTVHELDAETTVGEAVFVPAGGARGEDDGWLLSITTRRDGTASRLIVLDATAPAAAPVAAVDLPRGVPAGLHGSWIPDDV